MGRFSSGLNTCHWIRKNILDFQRYVREKGGIKWKNLQQNNDGREKYREVVRLGC